ncbi:MAG: helix-turn-helix transcriptional regulator [Pseudohongiellaceae bacterium]
MFASSMDWVNDLSATLAVSQLFLLGSFFLVHHSRRFLSLLMVVFSGCLCAYLLLVMSVSFPPLVTFALLLLAIATPAVLWLIANELFLDSGKSHPLALGLMAFYMLLRGGGTLLYSSDMAQANLWFLAVFVLPQLIMLGFAIHSVYIAFIGRSDDLVEERRRIRVPFIIGMGTLIAVILGNGFFLYPGPLADQLNFLSFSGLPDFMISLYTFLITFLFNLTIFRLHGDAFELIVERSEQTARKLQTVPQAKRTDPKLVERVLLTMETDRYYAKTGLTFGDLAGAVSIQEHHLRRIINKQMHYRNFNQFLNHFRIQDACERLKTTDESIANIAMDVGYASLSSFNKAFKEIHGIPPRAYRSLAQAGVSPLSAQVSRENR